LTVNHRNKHVLSAMRHMVVKEMCKQGGFYSIQREEWFCMFWVTFCYPADNTTGYFIILKMLWL